MKTHTKIAGTLVGIALAGVTTIAYAQTTDGSLARQMDIGARGSDVTTLQVLLATNRDVYPQGLTTGYYGTLTHAAVAQFQLAYGLPPVGRVGPLTLAKLNGILAMQAPVVDISAPIIMNVSVARGNTNVAITWTTNENSRGSTYFDVKPISETESSSPQSMPAISGSVAQETAFGTNHSVVLGNLQPNRTYYYVVTSTDLTGNVSVTVPQTFTTTP